MENIQTSPDGTIVQPVAPVAAVAPVQPVVAAAPMVAQPIPAPNPAFADGGAVAPAAGFWKNLNWIEVGFMIFGSTALYFTINYYRQNAIAKRKEIAELQREVDEVKMNVQTNMKGAYKTL